MTGKQTATALPSVQTHDVPVGHCQSLVQTVAPPENEVEEGAGVEETEEEGGIEVEGVAALAQSETACPMELAQTRGAAQSAEVVQTSLRPALPELSGTAQRRCSPHISPSSQSSLPLGLRKSQRQRKGVRE